MPADPRGSHAAIERVVGEALAAGAIPLVLGGDHSITEPCVRIACAAKHGPLGMITSTPTDSAEQVFGVKFSHGTFIRTLIEDGRRAGPLRADRLRGYWPGGDFAWQRERGITSLFAHDVRDLGIGVVARALAAVAEGPVYVTVDIDVLDPAFVPGTGTPEPGGLSSAELLWAAREVAARAEVVGAGLVEVIRPRSAPPTTRRWRGDRARDPHRDRSERLGVAAAG